MIGNDKHGGDIYRNKVSIDFSVNLNPLGTPPEVKNALSASLDRAGYYPDMYQEEVRRVIADHAGVPDECVFAGCGASQLLQAAVLSLAPKTALVFDPCFSGYRRVLAAAGCEVSSVTLSEENGFAITEEDIGCIKPGTDIVFLCDPANPSGKNIKDETIYKILDRAAHCGTAVILDESFYHMSEKALSEDPARIRNLPDRCEDLFIVRSMTKILALPGIRIGYVIASPQNLEKLVAHLPEWNLPVTCEEAIKAGIKILKDTDLVEKTAATIRCERQYLSEGLGELGLKVIGSDTAYLLFSGPEDLYEKLLNRGILIRDLSGCRGLGKGWYRIAVKTRADNDELIRSIRGIINGN